MKHKSNKGKPATKGRTDAPKSGALRRSGRGNDPEIALATLMALLHADRWLFEAAELAKKANMRGEIRDFNQIRLSIVKSLNRLQPHAYGAMSRGGNLGAEIL